MARTNLSEADRDVLLSYADFSSQVLGEAPVELLAKLIQNLPDLSDPKALAVSDILIGHRVARFGHFPASLWRHPGPMPLREAALRRLAEESDPVKSLGFRFYSGRDQGFEETFPGWHDEAVYALNRAALKAVLTEERYRNANSLRFLAHIRLHRAVQEGRVEALPTPALVEELELAPAALDWSTLKQLEGLLLQRADASLPDLARAGRTDLALRIFAKRAKKVERRDFEESFPDWFDAVNLPKNLELLSRLLDESGLREAEFRVLEAVAELHDPSHFPWLLPYGGLQHRPETRDFVLQRVQRLRDLEKHLLGPLEQTPEDPLLSSAHALRLDGEANRALADHIGTLLRTERNFRDVLHYIN